MPMACVGYLPIIFRSMPKGLGPIAVRNARCYFLSGLLGAAAALFSTETWIGEATRSVRIVAALPFFEDAILGACPPTRTVERMALLAPAAIETQ